MGCRVAIIGDVGELVGRLCGALGGPPEPAHWRPRPSPWIVISRSDGAGAGQCPRAGGSGRGEPRLSPLIGDTPPGAFGALWSHVNHESPHLCRITDPAVLAAELERGRRHYNAVRHRALRSVRP
jgi:hypothetical protein